MQAAKTVLLTGASGKLGKPLLRHLLQKDLCVIVTSHSRTKMRGLCRENHHYFENKKLYGIAVDLEKNNAVQIISSKLRKFRLFPECVIHNARNKKYLREQKSNSSSRDMFLREYYLDVVLPYELTMKLAFQSESKLTNVIHVSSIYGMVPPNPGVYKRGEATSPVQYGTAKAALIHLTKELAVRLAKRKIRVNAISLGGVEGGLSKDFVKRYSTHCPSGTMLRIEDVNHAISFLISDMSKGLTGHNLVVDGGWTLW